MDQNIILAGVGGQGILTVAKAISVAALRRGLAIKQAESHGMSQRGGAVESHLRLADHPIHSDLVPKGGGDLIIALDPLESLRYVPYLRETGRIVTSSSAFINIPNYPPVEDLLARVARTPGHALVDAERLARAAGSSRAGNMVVLGAAAADLCLEAPELEDAIREMFAAKGARVVETNLRAFRFGVNAAAAYRDALGRGGSSRAARHWIASLAPEHLAASEPPDAATFAFEDVPVGAMSEAEAHAFDRILTHAYESGRMQLYEHEVYALIQLVGAIAPPRHAFVPRGEPVTAELLARFPSKRLVLKLVSPQIIHKSDADALAFVPCELDAVTREIERLEGAFARDPEVLVEGVLLVEFVEEARKGFGSELFVGIRATREFGPVIAAGLGGVHTEYLARKMRPRAAVAKALADEVTPEEFLEQFRETAAYDVLLGLVRGTKAVTTDGELLRTFRAFLLMARRFCVDRGAEGPDLLELEVNPFAFRRQQMLPLDGRGRMRRVWSRPAPRPLERVAQLFEPRTAGVLGVSSTHQNFGRIILGNLLTSGFAPERLCVIKPGCDHVDGVHCIPSVEDLTEPLDLLVIAAKAEQLPEVIGQIAEHGNVHSAILIPGGVGETEGSHETEARVREAIAQCRARPDGGPVFLGPNSMGVQSRPGGYDTFFIPGAKLDKRWRAPARRAALLSQSGAFILSRLSNLETLDPALAVSIGNQVDLTLSDLLRATARRDDVDAIGVYAEGFNDLDGLDFAHATREARAAGKVVVFYKAGRTPSGRSAAAGHTAAVAGDYEVAKAAIAQAGAIVVESFKEFEQVMELATALHGKAARGGRVAALSNAGFETVGMADALLGAGYELEMAPLEADARAALGAVLESQRLTALVNPRNPLDLTPMANEDAYEGAIRVFLEAPNVDAVVVSVVPMTPQLATTPSELDRPGTLGERLPRLFAEATKPLVFVVDAGPLYDPLAQAVRSAGVPVFRSSDHAIRSLGRYLCARSGAC